jgi:hypothetical protein
VLIKDRTIDWPVVVETLQLATYPGMGQGKLEPGYSIHEEIIAHWEWRDGGSSMYPLGIVARHGRVMCSRVARTCSCSGGLHGNG